jgi:hypothetical protein
MWFASTVTLAPPTDNVFAAFVRRTDALGTPPLVVHTRAQMLRARAGPDTAGATRIDRVPAAQRIAVRVLTYHPNELTTQLSAPDSGWLMVTDRWAPGWRTTVNAKPVPTFGADFIFRAVPVRRGENVVRFTYQPAGYPWLLVMSWLTLAGVGGWSTTASVRTLLRVRAAASAARSGPGSSNLRHNASARSSHDATR